MKINNKYFSQEILNLYFFICIILDLLVSLFVIDGNKIIEKNFLLSFYNPMAQTLQGILLFMLVYIVLKIIFMIVINVIYALTSHKRKLKIIYIIVILLHIFAIINNLYLGVTLGTFY